MCEGAFVGLACDTQVTCRYWDNAVGGWSTEGCVALPDRGDGYLHCACTHLTDFGGVAVPTSADELLAEVTAMTFNTFTLDEAFGILSDFDFAANPTIYILVLVMAGLNLVHEPFAALRAAPCSQPSRPSD